MNKSEILELEKFLNYLKEKYDLEDYEPSEIASCYVLGYGLDDIRSSEMNYRGLSDLTDDDYDEC